MSLQCHSNTTPKGRSGIIVYTPVYGNSALHRHSKDSLLPLRQGKGHNPHGKILAKRKLKSRVGNIEI